MLRNLLVNYAPYHSNPVKPQCFRDFCAMYEAHGHVTGLWCLQRRNTRTGAVLSELWTPNIITDNGGLAMLKNTWNNAGSAIPIFNQIAIDTAAGSTTLTTALVSGTNYTSLAVAALPGPIASGATVTIGFGTGTTQTVTLSAGASQGAVNISVNSFQANANYAIGANVVPVPTTSDNPSALSGTTYYSGALPGGDFTFSGSGVGNRQVQIQYTFPASSGNAGAYTEAWTTNANPVVAGSTASHLIFPAQQVNNITSFLATIVDKV